MSASPCVRSSFLQGCRDSLPVCLTFIFLFSSIGALAGKAGFSLLQATAMTLTVHAAPLQALIVQQSDTLGIVALLVATVVVNFRFVIMSSVLAEQFQHVSLGRSLLSVQLLSISTFTLSKKCGKGPSDVYAYYLGCGVTTLGCAIAATAAGHYMGATPSAVVAQLIAIILPVHFIALACHAPGGLQPLQATVAGFVLTPLIGSQLGSLHVLVVPLATAVLLHVADTCSRKAAP
ncbi:MAG: AzlC family ABC transporter permease [Stenotrophomonas sp.]|jgi:predicted branched-subunit amino acid permease|nr:AzlC family ABC transporter permease [Stenotrophomonas sp.]